MKDWKTRWVWEQGQGVFNEESELLFCEGFVSDITDRRRAEQGLRDSEAWYRALFEGATDAILLLQGQEIIDCNGSHVTVQELIVVGEPQKLLCFTTGSGPRWTSRPRAAERLDVWRAAILEAEGLKQSAILKAQGDKEAEINRAEGLKRSAILQAEGEAEARIRVAEAEAEAIRQVTEVVKDADGDPTNYLVAIRYIETLREMVSGKDNKVVYLPFEATGVLSSLGGIKEMLGAKTPTAG